MIKVRVAAAAGVALAATGAFYSSVEAQDTTRSVWDGVYTEEQAQRGETLSRKECASCHGVGLTGGEAAPPLSGDAFLSNWNGLTVGDLFDRIRKTMPQDNPGRLSRAQDADVLAYMLSLNRFPAGKAELDHRSEVLKQIRIEAIKPEQTAAIRPRTFSRSEQRSRQPAFDSRGRDRAESKSEDAQTTDFVARHF